MALRDVLKILQERRLEIVFASPRPGQSPRFELRGQAEEITPALRAAVAAYEPEIVRAFAPTLPREWLWRTGHRHAEWPSDETFGLPDWHPCGAWWWRVTGDIDWRPVPGRNPDGLPPPVALLATL